MVPPLTLPPLHFDVREDVRQESIHRIQKQHFVIDVIAIVHKYAFEVESVRIEIENEKRGESK